MSSVLLKNLNTAQIQAVCHKNGPLLIVAGAGTGKTTVITRRIAWLIDQGLAKPEEILALTFTDKAAGEMEERVDTLLPIGYVNTWISTFHSFGERILKDYALEIGLPNEFRLLSGSEQWMMVRNNLDRFALNYYRPLGNPTRFIHALLQHFSRAKDEEVSPEEYLAYVKELSLNKDINPNVISTKRADRAQGEISHGTSMQGVGSFAAAQDDENFDLPRMQEVADAYHVYQQLLLENSALDFGDLINYTLKLLRTRPRVLRELHNRFKYILVDEFQDTNYAQYELIKLLAAPEDNIAVVGDDDQCLPGETLVDTPGGKEKIKNIRVGDAVLTAVGKGHMGISTITRTYITAKTARLLTFRTKNGFSITVTDNHKMFCHTPGKSDRKTFYTYLMHRRSLGWRLGITNDLATRLRLERSADRIIALRGFSTEAEARYFETFLSLNYGIPTSCFKEREGVIIRGSLLQKLYDDLGVDARAQKLAADLRVDLNAHHVCLAGVIRGESARLKINVQMCYRNHRSKNHVRSKRQVMSNPLIAHLVSIESSNTQIRNRITKAGYPVHSTKKGWRVRITSSDIEEIGRISTDLQAITGGILEYKFSVGKMRYQTLPSLIIPAKNLVKGLFIPVRVNGEIIYDQIIDIGEEKKKMTVYDLEVARTHNFIASGVVVHNSVYKFRGASISNILEFKRDFPNCDEVFLNQNYRSFQGILDTAYTFIQQNNPYRLEVTLKTKGKSGLSKKLIAERSGVSELAYLPFETGNDEAEGVIRKILELRKIETAPWSDFAILVRANSSAPAFLHALARYKIPFDYVANRGLYGTPIILEVVNYLRVLDNAHDSDALYRILTRDPFQIPHDDLVALAGYARKKTIPLYNALAHTEPIAKISEPARALIKKFLTSRGEHATYSRGHTAAETYVKIVHDLGIEERVAHPALAQDAQYLASFYRTITQFELEREDKRMHEFLAYLALELESGEEGRLPGNTDEGPDTVKVITVHSAKGLEWRYVFLVQLIDRRFPSVERKEPIELPTALIKETLPEGDVHLQEERRLFYVALTRARDGLYLTRAEDYSGKTTRRPSRFLTELGLVNDVKKLPRHVLPSPPIPLPEGEGGRRPGVGKLHYPMPDSFSFSSVSAFRKCPLEYKFRYLLKLPGPGAAQLSFGVTIHKALEEFLKLWKARMHATQGDLFSPSKSGKIALPTFDELTAMYERAWIDDWYDNPKQKEEYHLRRGISQLKNFYDNFTAAPPRPKYLEEFFKIAMGPYKFVGKIDRIDTPLPNPSPSGRGQGEGVTIIDYKTGEATPKKLEKVDRDQLIIYQIAAQDFLNEKVANAMYWHLQPNHFSEPFVATPAQMEKLKEEYTETIDTIVATIAQDSFVAADAAAPRHDCKFEHLA